MEWCWNIVQKGLRMQGDRMQCIVLRNAVGKNLKTRQVTPMTVMERTMVFVRNLQESECVEARR